MRRSALPLTIVIALAAALPASAQDAAAFRQCVAGEARSGVAESYAICAAPLAQPCASSATAKEAAGCIDAARHQVAGWVEAGASALADRRSEPLSEVMDDLNVIADGGAAACAAMADNDRRSGVATGQRAVNAAFCGLVATADVYAALIGLEDVE